jgi:putative NIF3 family GTP cyclohydrolase 1 type 2
MEVRSLGIVSGGAAWDVVTAAEEGLDAFLTGEPRHEVFAEAFERGVNALFAGHYMTETVGVNLLARELRERFGLATEFVLLPTGL